jgi:hypothetical protein
MYLHTEFMYNFSYLSFLAFHLDFYKDFPAIFLFPDQKKTSQHGIYAYLDPLGRGTLLFRVDFLFPGSSLKNERLVTVKNTIL